MTEITVDIDLPLTPDGIREAFERAYTDRFGADTTRRESPLEIMTFRVEGIASSGLPPLRDTPGRRTDPRAFRRAQRPVVLRHLGSVAAEVYDGDSMSPGSEVAGPALIERRDTTVWVPPGSTARTDGLRNVRLSLTN
jgi:N-methylhydantoinase A